MHLLRRALVGAAPAARPGHLGPPRAAPLPAGRPGRPKAPASAAAFFSRAVRASCRAAFRCLPARTAVCVISLARNSAFLALSRANNYALSASLTPRSAALRRDSSCLVVSRRLATRFSSAVRICLSRSTRLARTRTLPCASFLTPRR